MLVVVIVMVEEERAKLVCGGGGGREVACLEGRVENYGTVEITRKCDNATGAVEAQEGDAVAESRRRIETFAHKESPTDQSYPPANPLCQRLAHAPRVRFRSFLPLYRQPLDNALISRFVSVFVDCVLSYCLGFPPRASWLSGFLFPLSA